VGCRLVGSCATGGSYYARVMAANQAMVKRYSLVESGRDLEFIDALGGEHGVKVDDELDVPVANEETDYVI
jgi:hypothetical protein